MNRIETAIGHIPNPQLKPDESGKLGEAALLRMAATANQLVSLMNGKIRFGDGTPNSAGGNTDSLFLLVQFKAANTEIVMPHDLGRPPVIAWPSFKDRACDVYSMRGAANAWGDESKAYFACNVADAKVILFLH